MSSRTITAPKSSTKPDEPPLIDEKSLGDGKSIEDVWRSPDGTLAAYAVSDRGSEWVEVRVRGLADRKGSNGGLLVTVVINQRPDLFRAAVAAVPERDNLRYDRGRHAAQSAIGARVRGRLQGGPLACLKTTRHIRGMHRLLPLLLLAVLAESGAAQGAGELDASLQRLVGDYTGLYTKESFARWRELFLPSFTASSTTAEGGVTERRLDEFLGSQERGFAAATRMGERLENTQIIRKGRMATITSDFVYWNNDTERRGRLILTAIHSKDKGWRFASLLFSYHD